MAEVKEIKTVTLQIDDREVSVPSDTTIMHAAETIGVRIPRLCYHPDLSLLGGCRVCIVEVEGMDHYPASCSVAVAEGMVVRTNSPVIRQARRDIVELLIDNHHWDCQTCERDSRCELQNLAYAMGVRERLFEGARKRFPLENSSRSVVRDSEKCILCGRCYRVCGEVQGVHNLSQQYRGFTTIVTPAYGANMDDSVCIQCGQCINVCPTAAFLETNSTDAVWAALADPNKHVVVQTAPSIRAAIGEGLGLPPGTPATGKMITALRTLGFDAVFDTDLGADLTIVEESNEFLKRLEAGGPFPILTSCSSGWINFLEKFFPELIPFASTCKSPMSMISVLLKTYYPEKTERDPKSVYVVSVMPCVAKKYEALRPEHFFTRKIPYTDAVLTTRELVWMIRSYGIDFKGLPDGVFDSPLGVATGAGDIFGTTGGVMEASLRTISELLTGKPAERLDFTEVRAVEGLREATVDIDGRKLNVGVANGMANSKIILDKIARGEKQFHIVELMACPGGCIGGGGQPYPPPGYKILDPAILRMRANALYSIDGEKKLRQSHQNPVIQTIYREFLEKPGSEKAYRLLHTHYHPELPRGI
jgi:iron-only hydrogenase group A